MSAKMYKTCFVPCCFNNNKTEPDKIYISIPKVKSIRNKWFAAVNREFEYSYKTSFYCCQDHFDIPSDVENYLKYQLMGGTFKIKEDIVPHVFTCAKHDNVTCAEVNNAKIPRLESTVDTNASCTTDISLMSPISHGTKQTCLQHTRDIGVQTESIKRKLTNHTEDQYNFEMEDENRTTSGKYCNNGSHIKDDLADPLATLTGNSAVVKEEHNCGTWNTRKEAESTNEYVKEEIVVIEYATDNYIYDAAGINNDCPMHLSFECAECSETYTTKKELRLHLYKHLNSKTVSCKLCKKLLSSLKGFIRL